MIEVDLAGKVFGRLNYAFSKNGRKYWPIEKALTNKLYHIEVKQCQLD